MDLSVYCHILILYFTLGSFFLHGAREHGGTADSSLPHFNQTLIKTSNDGRQNPNVKEKYDNITLDVGATKVITVGSNRLTKLSLANNSKVCNLINVKGCDM